ncbi:MAG: hypothetical protein HYZ53_30960 [Planctomycetes bacterium]|nr:hypothetical protein [Planctomycetota bacterium]
MQAWASPDFARDAAVPGGIVVARHVCEYLLDEEGDEGGSVLKRALDRAAERLAAELEPALGGLLVPGEELVLVRRVEVDLALATECAVGRGPDGGAPAARAWADAVSQGLARSLQDPACARFATASPEGPPVVRFPTPSHFVAAFLAELLDGRAWDRWYFRCYEALRALPPGAGALAALTRCAADLGDILLAFRDQGEMDALVRLLGEEGCGRLLSAAAEAAERQGPWPTGGRLRELAALAARALDAAPRAEGARTGGGWSPGGGGGPAGNAAQRLRAWVLALPTTCEPRERAWLAAVLDLLARLRALLRHLPYPASVLRYLRGEESLPTAEVAQVERLLGRRDFLTALRSAAGPGGGGWLEEVLACRLDRGEAGSRPTADGRRHADVRGPEVRGAGPLADSRESRPVEALERALGGRVEDTERIFDESSNTAGVALLLGPFSELGAWESLREAGVAETQARHILLAALLSALGGWPGRLARLDERLPAVVGLNGAARDADLAAGFRGPDRLAALRAQRGLLVRLRASGRLGGGRFLLHVPDAPAGGVDTLPLSGDHPRRGSGDTAPRPAVFQECATGLWLGIGEANAGGAAALARRGLTDCGALEASRGGRPGLGLTVDGRVLGRWGRRALAAEFGAEVASFGEARDADERSRTRRRGFTGEWVHLVQAQRLPDEAGEGHECRLAMLLAQQACRLLARRLPGLEQSGAAYLGGALLAGGGRMRRAGEELRIEVNPGPLGVSLRVGGFREETLELPWLAGRVRVSLAGEE